MKHINIDIRRYLTFISLVSVLDFMRSIFVAKMLGPYQTGLCISLISIPQVALYLNLGLVNVPTVLVPFHRGENKPHLVEEIKNTVLNLTIIGALISFFAVLLYVMFFSKERSGINVYISMAALLIIMGQMRRYLMNNYVAENNFLKLSWLEFFFALAVFCFQIAMVYYLGGYGFWLGLIVASLLIIIYSGHDYLRSNHVSLFKINHKYVKKLIPLGTALLISSVAYVPFVISSKVFVAFTIGAREVGYFLLSIIVISKISIIPKAIARVMLPRMSILQGIDSNSPGIFRLFVRAQLYSLGVTFLLIILGWIFISPAVSFILPEYIPGIPAAKIMLIAGLPYCLIDNASNLLIVLHHKKKYLHILTAIFVLHVLIFVLLYLLGVSILYVSACCCLLFSLYAFLLNYKIFLIYKARVGTA